MFTTKAAKTLSVPDKVTAFQVIVSLEPLLVAFDSTVINASPLNEYI